MKTYAYLLVILISGCEGCKDDPKPKTELEKLPPITQTGENTFGCLVNGKAIAITNSLKMTAIYQGGFLQFGAGGIYFIVVDPFETDQSYDLTDGDSYKVQYTKEIDEGVFCFYEFEDTYEGTVFFSKIDRTEYIISGTFEFSTVTTDCDTMRITDGRFDMQYVP